MPWKESSVMDERLRFLARVLDGEPMTEVCRDFGISRKTGYKIFDRYKEHGLEALSDRSRRPVRFANQLPAQLEARIVAVKREKPHWGARKIRELLIRRLPGDVRVPAKSTIHAVLHRHGLVAPPGRPRYRATGTPLSHGSAPNQLWCADFKGEFKLGDGRYCYPLPSAITPRATCFYARPWSLPVRISPLRPLSGSSASVACPMQYAPTTEFPSPAPTRCSTSRSSPSGG